MRANRVLPLVVVACSARGSPRPVGSAGCADLSVAAAIGHQLRDQVSAQYASADRAMTLFEKTLPSGAPAEDPSGTVSGAGQRGFSYQRVGLALCESARLVDAGMLEMSRRAQLDSAEVRAAENSLERFTCTLASSPRAGDAQTRQSALQEWSSMSKLALDAEGALVTACVRQSGEAPPEVHLTPMVLINE